MTEELEEQRKSLSLIKGEKVAITVADQEIEKLE